MKKKLLLECKSRYPIYYHSGGKMAIINTLFMTKTAEKPYPLGPHIQYIAHIREYPPWLLLESPCSEAFCNPILAYTYL